MPSCCRRSESQGSTYDRREKYIGTELNERSRSFRVSEAKFPTLADANRLLDLICEVAKLDSDRNRRFLFPPSGAWCSDVHLSYWPSMTSRMSIFRRGSKFVVLGVMFLGLSM